MLTRKELAQGLDISQPMVSRLVARGMPEHSVAAAEHWRRQHLNIAKVKRHRHVELRPTAAAELVELVELAEGIAEIMSAQAGAFAEGLSQLLAVLGTLARLDESAVQALVLPPQVADAVHAELGATDHE